MSISPKENYKDQHTNKHNSDTAEQSTTKKKPSQLQPSTYTVAQIKQRCKVAPIQLKKYTDALSLPESTEHIQSTNLSLGQTRAIHAIKTAFEIPATGYHVFAVGENGLGKRTFITHYLQKQGHQQKTLVDWVYAHNFHNPRVPLAIDLPAGTAPKLQSALFDIWYSLSNALADQNAAHNNNYQAAANQTIAPLFKQLLSAYSNNSKLMDYLSAMQEDMLVNAAAIAASNDSRFLVDNLRLVPDRYCLNIMVSQTNVNEMSKPSLSMMATNTRPAAHHTPDGAPIIFEPYPKLSNLLGCIGQTTQDGSIISNHNMIQAGALHQANGGYLIIEASHLAEHLDAWQALKRTLQARTIELSNYRQSDELGGLKFYPEPIPLNLKVILLGDPDLYDQFAELDLEFNATFKIRADFHDEVMRSHENELAMIAKMADIIDKYKLKHFDNTAQAVVLEYLSLQSEDQNKLSLHTDRLIQLMLEANRLAETPKSSLVTAAHIKQALSDMTYRSSYLKELYLQEITDGQQLISTTGKAVGQINALTIVDYADSEFGMPALLTAVVQHSTGSGDILDIERDVELGGSLHAKGMLIMNSYLRALFSPYHPLNFTASLAFEQSYAHIDGDSATLAEACALLSALADIPIAQSLAITGSMNQLGRVQAVGGINAKVAGFFDACSHQGLSGNQGVILPYANISQLMLRDDIIESVEAGEFHIYGVKTLSEALTILAELPVDTVNKKGRYRKSSLFGKIIKNLKKWEDQLNPPEDDENIADANECCHNQEHCAANDKTAHHYKSHPSKNPN